MTQVSIYATLTYQEEDELTYKKATKYFNEIIIYTTSKFRKSTSMGKIDKKYELE